MKCCLIELKMSAVKLVIRDDDANFFTKVEDLEKVYSSIPDFPISYAVVPTVVDVLGGCPDTEGNIKPMYIGENAELVNYFKNRVKNGKCDILLHGIHHEYKTINGLKTPEMLWRETDDNLSELIGFWKTNFSELFDYNVKCFVAPSNKIGKNGIKAVYENGMNYSGIIPISFQRDVNTYSILNYIRRFVVRAVKGFPYPGVLDYGSHLELNACNTIDYDYLVKLFKYCEGLNSPMAINVHYWHIRDFPEYYKGFFDFVKYAIDHGAVPSRMSDCF